MRALLILLFCGLSSLGSACCINFTGKDDTVYLDSGKIQVESIHCPEKIDLGELGRSQKLLIQKRNRIGFLIISVP